MSWVESHQSLSRHRKTLRAASILHVDRHKLIGHLHELWWWGLDNAGRDGELYDATPTEIAHGAGWPDKRATEFVNALIAVRFMDEGPNGLSLHDWFDYAGKLGDQRDLRKEKNRESQRRRRDRLRIVTADGQHNVTMTEGDGQQSTLPTVPTKPTTSSDDDVHAVDDSHLLRRRVDETFKAELENEFASIFGSQEAVRDKIEHAMNGKAYRGYTDKRRGLRGWLTAAAKDTRNGHEEVKRSTADAIEAERYALIRRRAAADAAGDA